MFVLAGAFTVVAVVWGAVVAVAGGTWWGPIHAFVAGAALAAISGATQMFTITLSTTSAPPPWITSVQRWLLGLGVTLVLIGVPTANSLVTWVGGIATLLSLAVLALSLVSTVNRSLLRRFDQSIRFYLLAIGCGLIGLTLGILIATGSIGPDGYAAARFVHLHLNVIGLIGFTIVGTVPTLLPTFVPHAAVSGGELRFAWWLSVASAVAIVGGLVGPLYLVGWGAMGAGVASIAVVAPIVVRLGRKGARGGLPFASVVMGLGWLATWAIIDGFSIVAGTPPPSFSTWTASAVIVGIGQVLTGSMSHLIPVLIGPPIAANVERLRSAPVIPLVAVNTAGLLLVIGLPIAAMVPGAVWALDFLRRLMALRRPVRNPRSS